jgi:alkaline phosphatase D
MATGLYPDHHGIVNNSFYDQDMDAYYSIGNDKAVTNGDFYDGEPIWVTAEQQNVTSASFFWVGSEAEIKGILPTYTKKYDHSFPYEQRLDTVIYWLNLPAKKRPHLILWYIDEPDSQGHSTGPESNEVKNVVEYLDGLVGEFMAKINALPHADQINVIVTSDHGMSEISSDRSIALTEHINPDWFDVIQGSNPVYNFKVKQEFADEALDALTNISNISAWKNEDIPENLHYGTNPRVLDIVAVADSSWSIRWNPPQNAYSGGAHGYDNANKDMHAIFYATGPAFKSGYLHPGFNNIDIYPLIAEILGILPADVDGSLANVTSLLKSK